MNDDFEWWIVEQYVDLGNETFWHEKARLLRRVSDQETMARNAHKVGERDVLKHGGRYRIRVVKEETVYDSEEISV
ncbi:hypothetical protein ABZ154_09085 [Streptomyces sp. NPDC006261]|uniref:hypothetical protein n=1 Tax=Streptomyces sp. NPDC006261 TaxID=3156739 RepID=UPI0033AC166C